MTRHLKPAAFAAARPLIPGPRGLVRAPRAEKTPIELMADLNKTFEQFKTANDERLRAIEAKGAADTVLTEKVDRINAEITKITKDWQAAVAEIEKKLNRPQLGAGDEAERKSLKLFNQSLKAHAIARGRARPADLDADSLSIYRAGLEQFLRAGRDGMEVKAATVMQVGSDPDGGYLCTPEMDQAIDKLARDLGAMRSVATVRTIGSASFKKRVQTTGAAAGGWGNERTAPSTTDAPRLAELTFTPGTLWAEPEVTTEVLEDASIDIESYLAEEVGITFSEQEEDAFVDGSGVDRPRGFQSYPTVDETGDPSLWTWGNIGFVKSGAAADFAAANPSDRLIELQHALKRQYRAGAVWMMNDQVLAKIRKFKDGQGNYLWVPGLERGVIGVLFGKEVVTNDFMPNVGANAFPVAFGDFRRGYLIVDRRGTVVLRDPFTAKPYIKFFTTRRVGGGVQNFQAIKMLKCAA